MILNSELGVVYGLNIMTKTERLSNLEVGIVTINNEVISDPRIPVGGVKNSGLGRVIKIWNIRICQCQVS
jgi:succinate-semialdehyde dehydrogenase